MLLRQQQISRHGLLGSSSPVRCVLHCRRRRRISYHVSSDFLWYLPTHGDGRNLVAGAFHAGKSSDRPADFDYLKQIAWAAERAGFLGTLIPTGSYCEDAWLVAAAVAQYTKRLKPLVAFRPGFVLPAVAAQTAASFQSLTDNRL